MTRFSLPLLFGLLLAVCPMLLQADETHSPRDQAVVPEKPIKLLNGQDLSAWYTWLTDDLHKDPRGVFTLQPDGTLRISGDGFGGLITNKEYADYHLVIEYRWGEETFRTRKDRARDGGLLLHCQGPDGNYGGSKGAVSPWMTSIECQIIEGGVGDILVLQGKDENGETITASATCEISRDRDGEAVWTPGGEKTVFHRGRINWSGRDPDWKDVINFRGKNDVESPGHEWTRVDCYCKGDTLTYLVNGTLVNHATDVQPTHGKILLQTEGAEMFVRKLELRPLPEKIPQPKVTQQ